MASDNAITSLLAKSALTGVIGGVASHFVFAAPSGAEMSSLLGTWSIPLTVGAAVALSQLGGELINNLVLDDPKRQEYNAMLSGFLMPVLAAGSSVAVGYILLGGGIDMQGMLMLAGTAAGAVIASDYVYDSFLAGMFA